MYHNNIDLILTFLSLFLITNVFGAPGASIWPNNQSITSKAGTENTATQRSIDHSNYDKTPSKLIVTLKGEAKDAQSSRAGIYILGPNMVNGKSHWLQNPGTNAIWYTKEKRHWHIADQVHLGNDRAWIFSSEDVAGPQEATTWEYYDDKWIISDDILVDTYSEPGTTANGLTSKDHLEIGEKADKKVAKIMANTASCKGESSSIKPLADDHFKNSSASKNESLELVGRTTSKTTDIIESTTKKIEETPNASPVVDFSKKYTRQFDGLSYFGGVLTTCGIVAIAFVGIKLYRRPKIETENYNLM